MEKIRDYRDSDHKAVMGILKENSMYDDVWDSREMLKRKIKNNPGSIIVAVEGGKVIGCVYLVVDGWAFIFRLAVKKEFQRKGIGGDLLGEAESRLRKLGVREVSIMVKESEVPRLEGYYKKRGYLPWKNRHQGFYKVL